MKSFFLEFYISLTLILTFVNVKALDISGIVTDKNGKPLPATTVFIGGSKKVTATDGTGVFAFYNLDAGTYQLVSTRVGFKTEKHIVNLNSESVTVKIVLEEKLTLLKEVVIVFRDTNRSEYLEWFIKGFLGETKNSKECVLENPDAIKFSFNKQAQILYATSDDFLIVTNKSLGYKINYLLDTFQFSKSSRTTSYNGEVIFENLEGNEITQQKWEENRREAYYGSFMHYLRMLHKGTTEQEGFFSYQQITAGRAKLINPDIWVKDVDSTAFVALTIIKGLYVNYKPKMIDKKARRGYDEIERTLKRDNESLVKPYLKYALIDKKGSYVDYKSFLLRGHWGRYRLADMLPFEYEP